MFDLKAPFGLVSLLLLISAALHISVFAVTMGGCAVPLLSGAVFWLILSIGLRRGNRWLAGFAFLAAAFGGSVALGYGLSAFGLASGLLIAIAVVDWLAAALLFVALWRTPAAG